MNIALLFIANASIMIIEIVGARAFAPFMGTSTEVWSGVIGTVLLGLTLGYYLGGKFADVIQKQGGSLYKLAGWMVIAAGSFIILSWTHIDMISLLGSRLMGPLGLTLSAAAITLVAFVPASLFLSALSPTIARIKLSALDNAASTVGSLSAVAAAGSIVGSFCAGLVFIPYFGSKETLIGVGIVLVVSGIIYGSKAKWSKKNILVLLLIIVLLSISYASGRAAEDVNEAKGIVADIDTRYQRLWVRDEHWPTNNRDVRVIQTDPFGTQCAMFKDEIGTGKVNPAFAYTVAFKEATNQIVKAMNFKPKEITVVGGCNYSFPLYLSQNFKDSHITVAELDPKMEEVAKTWFAFERPKNMDIVTGDARNFFNAKAQTKADLIYYDAFNSFSTIPHQLATKEAFESVKSHMSSEGVLILNVISSIKGNTSQIGGSMYKTLSEVFPFVSFYKIKNMPDETIQNVIAIASFKEIQMNETFLQKFDASGFESQMILTDNFAPVERLSKPIRDYVIKN